MVEEDTIHPNNRYQLSDLGKEAGHVPYFFFFYKEVFIKSSCVS